MEPAFMDGASISATLSRIGGIWDVTAMLLLRNWLARRLLRGLQNCALHACRCHLGAQAAIALPHWGVLM